MNTTNRNLVIGLAGLMILLISILIYSQVNASHNYDLGSFQQQAEQ
ncbi:hypothetical protein Q31b_09980 [Novipirellula aureliae]|uniref:Uncharacterized protein n=1 Tax=Novipirellula aureliae TaxID=2527966 RepID=A0A5C6E9Y7_9BACT|nr:hypothetical protein [Novipirellula aureliae]TWU45822.1 hypothetical protein Q31b_09980 [Novipirellula aureliae]